MSSIKNLSAKQLLQAANLKEKIEALEKELNLLFGSVAASPMKKSGMSAAAKAKISVAAKARWAKIRSSRDPA